MRTIEYDHDDAILADIPVGYADWKDQPKMVLAQVDELLEPLGLEVVILDTGGYDYFWILEPRKEKA